VKKPILFCNGGWMTHYKGITESDKIIGGGSYVKIEGRGHEVCNFVDVNGKVFGYVQQSGSQIRIERIGALPTDEEINGVDVVFTATRPGKKGGTFIVGWYKDATVYRHPQKIKTQSSLHAKNNIDTYLVCADYKKSKLLAPDERTFVLPRTKGGMGTSLVWYADAPEIQKWADLARDYIDQKTLGTKETGSPRQQDPAIRAQIEKVAIDRTVAHYEKIGYEVRSVEKDNLGWDLEASTKDIKLHIEVKGLSGVSICAELTPNEYIALNGTHKSDFRIAIVNMALVNPTLHIFSYNHVSENWECESNGAMLSFKEKTAAVVTCILPTRQNGFATQSHL